MVKLNTCVFISGKGSNLKSLIKFSKKKKYPFSVDLHPTIVYTNGISEIDKDYKIKLRGNSE